MFSPVFALRALVDFLGDPSMVMDVCLRVDLRGLARFGAGVNSSSCSSFTMLSSSAESSSTMTFLRAVRRVGRDDAASDMAVGTFCCWATCAEVVEQCGSNVYMMRSSQNKRQAFTQPRSLVQCRRMTALQSRRRFTTLIWSSRSPNLICLSSNSRLSNKAVSFPRHSNLSLETP